MRKITFFAGLLVLVVQPVLVSAQVVSIQSPDKKIDVRLQEKSGVIFYSVNYNGKKVIRDSRLGLTTSQGDFSSNLKIIKASPVAAVNDSYELFTGKKRLINYKANRRIIQFSAPDNRSLEVNFQVSDDGVAFRYQLTGTAKDSITVLDEITTYAFDSSAKAFLQPMQVAKSGWEKSNPAYEENYQQNIPAGTPSPSGAGWVYPALFNQNDTWLLITEAGMDGSYCATRLVCQQGNPIYKVSFPDPRETMSADGLLPKSSFPFQSPWRVITIGSLATIIESTLGTDVASPSIQMNKSFIKPGKSSWSWIMSKDDSIVYSEQIRYIDFAADMHWQYCLVDAAWDTKIGYEKVKELAAYANSKNIGLLLWYNSSGDWNTVKYTPKNKMLTHESRVQEFSLLSSMGVKGVKIDFFGGDGRSVIKYYNDILKDAAAAGIMINFHGATLPRGWSRTYPNLLTTEAVKGFEMVTFNQRDADVQANHCAVLPFTRNAFDPMDFTPMNLYKIPTRVVRKTTSAFELATSVLFLSGIQHFAESPAGMSHVPDYVKTFLRDLPVRWDDVKFIDGFPGKYVVIARKSGAKWYVAGINGDGAEKLVNLNMASFKMKKGTLITDGDEALTFKSEAVDPATLKSVTMKGNGGFVVVLE
jgi:hypothetical protein